MISELNNYNPLPITSIYHHFTLPTNQCVRKMLMRHAGQKQSTAI